MQMTAFALGQLLPESQRPFPMDMIHINDTRSDIVPNAGQPMSHTALAPPPAPLPPPFSVWPLVRSMRVTRLAFLRCALAACQLLVIHSVLGICHV